MKKVLALIMAGAMALSMVACGGGSGDGGDADDGSLRVGLIASSMGTQSFNDDVWAGLENAETDLGIAAEYIEVSEVSDAANSLRTLIAQGDTLLIVPSSEFHDAMMEVAAEYPDCDFMYLAGEETGAENVMSVEYKENEAAFLGGALAASLSQTGKIGTVLAVQEPLQLRYQYGYMAGAKTVNKDCEVSVLFTNSYTDTNLGQESAKALYDQGADYVSCFAGACNLGVFNAAKEAGDGKYCLGAATGQFDKMPDKIVASVVKSIDVALYDMIKDYKDNGTFNGGSCTVLGLKEGGVELRYTTMNDDLLNSIPEDVKTNIEDLKNKIINGEITVPGTEEEYNTYIASLG